MMMTMTMVMMPTRPIRPALKAVGRWLVLADVLGPVGLPECSHAAEPGMWPLWLRAGLHPSCPWPLLMLACAPRHLGGAAWVLALST